MSAPVAGRTTVNDQDDTRPIDCVKCGRAVISPRWIGWQGPLCTSCFERLEREEEVRVHHVRVARQGLGGWIRGLLGERARDEG
jgi:hypothetical protein